MNTTTTSHTPADATSSDTVEVRIVKESKSFIAGFLLAFLFGPIGLLYSSIGLGIVMILISIFLTFTTLGLAVALVWPLCWILSPIAIAVHNGSRGDDTQT